MPPEVLVGWGHRQRASQLVRDCVAAVTGTDPGPVFHSCPRCGSVEHGRPYVDAPVKVSLAYADDVVVVAVCATTAVGVDVETTAALARAGADAEWVRAEARFKAGGEATTAMLDTPDGVVAAVAVLSPAAPEVRVLAATTRTAR